MQKLRIFLMKSDDNCRGAAGAQSHTPSLAQIYNIIRVITGHN